VAYIRTNQFILGNMKPLSNQFVLVTGASGGIGGAIAVAMAEQGARVCISGRDERKLSELAERLRSICTQIDCFRCDLTKDDEVDNLVRQIGQNFSRLDILVHSAGGIEFGRLDGISLTSLDKLYATNVRGPQMLTQKLLPLLKQSRGQVVFINSTVALAARANVGYYSATQHAFKALADCLRDEINSEGIRVLSVFLGRTATTLVETMHAIEGRPYCPELLMQPEDVARIVLSAVTMPWTAEVTNIHVRPMQKSY